MSHRLLIIVPSFNLCCNKMWDIVLYSSIFTIFLLLGLCFWMFQRWCEKRRLSKTKQKLWFLEMGTGILNRRHFVFYHGDAPCFKLDIFNLNFPPLLVKSGKNCHASTWDRIRDLSHVNQECYLKTNKSNSSNWQKNKTITICGGKFKLSMSNLKQGASSW